MTRNDGRTALALGTLWLVWGSTYLAASWVLPALPPFVMAGVRFAVAGPLLLAVALATGAPRPTAREARSAAVVGLLLFVGGNGGTMLGQTRVPSSVAAVLVGLVPLWLVLLGAWIDGERPHPRRLAGVGLGMVGLVGLVGGVGGGHVDPVGVGVLACASACWATGTMVARHRPMPRALVWSTAVQMLAGAAGLWLAAAVTGQLGAVDLARFDLRAAASLGWLVLGGSIAGLVAYNWLLRETTPTVATTYAYVNPLVAVWLGRWLGGERLGATQLAWAAAIVGAVVLVTSAPAASRSPALARSR